MGYVGCVTAACLARLGHRVLGVDVSAAKVEMIESGRSPVLEPGLDQLIAEGRSAGRLRATTDAVAAVHGSTISLICVGTPSLRNGKLDLSHIGAVAQQIGAALREKTQFHTIALRSTVLPGTTESLLLAELEQASGRHGGADFAVCYNPEFMREGTAVADFLHPPFTVIGARTPEELRPLREIYDAIPGRVFETCICVAEMTKYVSNAFHALKIGFANEIGTLCKNLGVDTEMVTQVFTADCKLNISPAYLSPGFAFGGSCLPKDLRALSYRAKELDLCLPLLESIERSNSEHLRRAAELVLQTGKMKIAMLGLSFKAATDDLRESPHVRLVKILLGEGRQVKIWDDNVYFGRLVGSNRRYIEEVIPHIGSLLCSTMEEAVQDSEVVVVGTRGQQNGNLSQHLKPDHILIDLVNLEKNRRAQTASSYEGLCW
jgi:GDP-mannose 6-dehydrogenase